MARAGCDCGFGLAGGRGRCVVGAGVGLGSRTVDDFVAVEGVGNWEIAVSVEAAGS